MIEEPFEITDDVFDGYDKKTGKRYFTSATLYVPKGCKARYEATAGWKRFSKIIEDVQMVYRPMIEEDKVWKVGEVLSNPMQLVEYYYFDGDTIIDRRTCKQMMCQLYVSPEHPNYDALQKGLNIVNGQKVFVK